MVARAARLDHTRAVSPAGCGRGRPVTVELELRPNRPTGVGIDFLGWPLSVAFGAGGVLVVLDDGTVRSVGTTIGGAESLRDVQQIAAGSNHVCALHRDGTVDCWGWNNNGELGLGSIGACFRATPQRVTAISGIARIYAEGSSTCALGADRQLWCWGYDYMGRLGRGTPNMSIAAPRVVTSNVFAVAMAWDHSCLLRANTVVCAGRNNVGPTMRVRSGARGTCPACPRSPSPSTPPSASRSDRRARAFDSTRRAGDSDVSDDETHVSSRAAAALRLAVLRVDVRGMRAALGAVMSTLSAHRLDRARLALVLELHRQAYALWLWLADSALREPEWLSESVEHALLEPRRARRWLVDHAADLPAHLRVPPAHEAALAGLVSSFLRTSFRIARVAWDGRLVDAKLVRGAAHAGASEARRRRHGGSATHEALHRLCPDERLAVGADVLRAIARTKSLAPDVALWSYVVGLAARAEGRGEGADDWERWRSLDRDVRKELDVDVVWTARERLLAALSARAAAAT